MGEQKIHFIVNPAAGQGKPILNLINDILNPTQFDWDVSITKEEGDGLRLARKAIADGTSLVAVYGGDGSVREVACGLANSEVPLGIIPGGTGNVMSIELGIPRDPETAIRLLIDNNHHVRTVDMGMASDHGFILRLGVGLEATIIEGAGRELKDRYGIFAYIMSGILALREPVIANYHMTIDGKEFTYDGMVCIVANAGNLGVPGLFLSPKLM
jgi:diacylglycerol kinase (ATP)